MCDLKCTYKCLNTCLYNKSMENKNEFFNGQIQYIKIFDHILSDKERDEEYRKMENKVIFESENEVRKIYNLLKDDEDIHNGTASNVITVLKKHGYIRKSAEEEAEEICLNKKDILGNDGLKILKAIQEQRKEIEVLKNSKSYI